MRRRAKQGVLQGDIVQEQLWNKKGQEHRGQGGASRLDESVENYLKGRGRELERNGAVVEEWERLLPEGLSEHCSLICMERGVLEVEVDAGAYMHELRAIGGELVEELKRRCPRAGVREIRLRAR